MWTTNEINAVQRNMSEYMLLGQVPGKIACLKCIKDEPVLQKRNWKVVKFWINNYIKKQNKIQK